MRSKKGKLFLSLVALVFSLGVMCFGVYSAASVQYTIGGNVYYEVPTPPVRITKITSGNTILSTSSITLELGKPYPLDYSLEIQPNSTYVDPEHPQGQRTEIFLQMSSNISNFARMFINYDSTTNSDVKVNASSLYLKSSGIYKIYIDNNSSSAVNLNTLGITIQYDEKESILQYDETNKYFYVEMGTLMRDNATQNEYIKWRLIGTQTAEATSSTASQYTIFDIESTTAPSAGTVGVFILETNTLLERDDETGYLLNQVAFNHSYLGHGSDTSYYHNGDEWEEYNILANDYATSTVRQYINGNNVINYSITVTPIERAVPATILIAASTEAAFKSSIFCSAIAFTCSFVIDATFSLFGFPEPFSNLIAFLINTATGGTFVINVNDLSEYTVITTGIIIPG